MPKYRKFLPNQYLYAGASNKGTELFDFTMNNIMEGFYDSAMGTTTDGAFKAICLSGIRTEKNDGTGADPADGKKVGEYMNIVVRPLTSFGDIIPDPLQYSDALSINQSISLHSGYFTARSDFTWKDHSPIKFGQIINCYFEDGSITQSNFVGLRFSEPHSVELNTDYVKLSAIKGIESAAGAFTTASPFLLGEDPSSGDLQVDNIMKKWANDLSPAGMAIGGTGMDTLHLKLLTESQLNFWKGRKEKGTGPEYQTLLAYWAKIGMAPPSWTYNGTPWSAAFISWILMSERLVGANFPGAASHMKYTENIINNKGPGWQAYSLTKGKAFINVGDVLIKPRGSGKPKDDPYWYSHGDLVYKIENGVAFLAGGNVGNTAKIAAKIKLDSEGRANKTGKYIVILKKVQ